MAKLQAPIDKLIKDFGEENVMVMADAIRAYLTAPAADPKNLEQLSQRLEELKTKRDARHVANVANDNRVMDVRLKKIDSLLRAAMDTMRNMPVGSIRPQSIGSGWPAIVREWSDYGAVKAESPRCIPTSDDIVAMDRMFRALWQLPDEGMRKILMLHASGHSFRKLAKEFHCGKTTIQRRYQDGLAALAEIYFKVGGQTGQF